MKIGIDISTFAQKHSGIQVYVKNILDCLQQIDGEDEYYLFEYIQSGYIITNPKWHIITKKKPKGFGSRTIWFQIIFPLMLNKHQISVLWSPDFFVPIFVSRKIRVVLTIHDLTFVRYPETMDKKLLQRFRIYFAKSVKRATVLVTVSEYIKKEILAYIPEARNKQIKVAENGKPLWQLPKEDKVEERTLFLFFAGNFEPRKNILNLIKAMELLYQQNIVIQLHISGNSGWENSTIHEYIRNSSIKNEIVFLGYLSEQQLIEKYCNCKALIFPSLYEGFGMPVVEALSLDCLVLTSKGTVMEEICGRAAIYFDPLEPRDIADKIKSVFDLSFDRNQYLLHRTDVLNRFDWKKTAEIIHQEITTKQG